MYLNNNSTNSCVKYSDGRVIETNRIRGVYFRQPTVPDLSFKIAKSELEFAQREALEALRSLWRIIDENLWLNHPRYLLMANNKIDQLQRAVKLGFKIPPTCISTDPKAIKDFYRSFNGDIIVKAVKHGFYKKGQKVEIVPTQIIGKNFIEDINNYAKIPMIFQKKVEKKYDIRVTVIGQQVYSAAIHSQEHEKTKIDWRLWDIHRDINLRHSKFNLPESISRLCLDITQVFNLNFSAIDLIYSTDNKYYFLEMNPNGQWAWIEEKVGFPIRDSIINCLGLTKS